MNRKDKSFLQKNPEMHFKNDDKCTHRKISKNKRLSYQNLAFAGLHGSDSFSPLIPKQQLTDYNWYW